MKKLISFLLTLALSLSLIIPVTFAANYEYIPSASWTVTTNSDRGLTIKNVIDGNPMSYWHSKYVAEGGQITSRDEAPFEVVVTFPSDKKIAGISYLPRQISGTDNSVAGIALKISLYYSADGVNFTHIKDDTYSYANASDRGERTTLFDVVTAKAFKFVITEGNGGYGTCAELGFMKSSPDDKDDDETKNTVVSREHEVTAGTFNVKGEVARDAYEYSSNWKITASSSFGSAGIANLFDRDKSTYWHSWYYYDGEAKAITTKDELPIEVKVEFPYAKWVSGIRYTPRQDANISGVISHVEVYGSKDGETFSKITSDSYTYTAHSDRSTKKTTFPETLVKAIIVRFTGGQGGYATGAELEILKGESSGELILNKEVERRESVGLSTPNIKSSPITPKGTAESDTIPYSNDWVIESNSATGAANLASFFDRNPDTRWHSWYRAEGSTVVEQSDAPYDVFITFPDEVTLKGVRYTPRPQGTTGIVDAAEVYGSSDGFRYVLLGEGKFDYGSNYGTRNKQTISFDDVTVKTICFRMTKCYGGSHGTGAELEFIKGDEVFAVHIEDYLRFNEKTVGIITLTIDSFDADKDGNTVKLVSPATIVESRTLVPVRFISETMGAKVTWNAEKREVGIKNDEFDIKLIIDSNRATVNGRVSLLDSPPRIINNSTMVPIRFISETMGSEVEWDGEARQVKIKYKKSIGIWGDGLAASAGAVTEQLDEKLYQLTGGIKVTAYGGENENALTVAARQGAYDIIVTEDVTLAPSGGTEIKIALADGREIAPRSGLGGWNECVIDGNKGILAFDVDYTVSPRKLRNVRFIRSGGSEVTIKKGTKIETEASGKITNIGIFTLGNAALHRESPEELVAILKDMINASGSKDSYIVLTPLEGDEEELKPYEEAYKEAFGDKCIITREIFLSEEAKQKFDIVVNDKNMADYEKKRVPVDFLRGKNNRGHLNDFGYNLLSEVIYEKMAELGYIVK